jgi:hypothetical protein
MDYEILKPFPFSNDGIHPSEAKVGEVRGDLPDGTIGGLVREGYIREAKGSVSPQNKAVFGAAEDKAPQEPGGAEGVSLAGLSKAKLQQIAEDEGHPFKRDDSKADLVAAIRDGRGRA